MANEKVGLDCKLYYKAGGVGGGGAWSELLGVRDVSGSGETTAAEVQGRDSVVKKYRPGQRDISIEFEVVWDKANTGHVALRDAFQNRTYVGIRMLDGPSGSQSTGPEGDFMVQTFSQNQPVEDAVTFSVTLKPWGDITQVTV